ncbi:hypothetical protein SAMN05444005_10827 [Flavobacterium urocaniciphilum]|uniref:Uncharacterized protein n=1 Tax=Flavobacterium urocaniciphilum TaxID=1299341 RepID=A0A1H9DTK6_9FLAO|nr:hypothetical protein SAMN05444005_10827 [Flavobacterium urocaniciphilum]
MKLLGFDYLYMMAYEDIVIKKKSQIFNMIFYLSLIYSEIVATFLNFVSIFIDYRIFKNVFYNVFLFILFVLFNYFIYEIKKRRLIIQKEYVFYKTYYVDIIFLISGVVFVYSIYLNNKIFGIIGSVSN